MLIKRKSIFTGIEREMNLPITQRQVDDHANGGRIQDVMNNLTKDQREFYLSGSTPEEWEERFPEEKTTLGAS